MSDPSINPNRRKFLSQASQVAAGISLTGAFGRSLHGGSNTKRPKVAVVLTEFSFRSHAHVILENFLEPYYHNGVLTDPGVDVVSFYVDQFPVDRDMARDVADNYGIKIFPTINDALCLGGESLAVDGVLSIAEFGDYPVNSKGQRMYPRKRFFDEIVAVMKRSGRSVPLFNDKHLSYRKDWALEMYKTAQQLNIPFMAGSSVPLAQRRPPLELEDGVQIDEAVAIHGGPLEVYDFHSLEQLESLIEFRSGGETGIESVRFLQGDDVWKAADADEWSADLASAAIQAELGSDHPPLRAFVEPGSVDGNVIPSHAILLRYYDGLRATVLRVGSNDFRWNFSCRINGDPTPLATSFYVGPWRNRNLFKALAYSIQRFIIRKHAPYPVERTLLATAVLDAAMESRVNQGRVENLPAPAITYQPQDFRDMREMGENWKIITEEMPEPQGIEPGGPRP
ncbi:MAG: hypothetical protein MK102_03620 [Fuerstiella sp.]|nr:hypothetical protein [Fuerstiella sp.]